jgi:hypothetical protein
MLPQSTRSTVRSASGRGRQEASEGDLTPHQRELVAFKGILSNAMHIIRNGPDPCNRGVHLQRLLHVLDTLATELVATIENDLGDS